MTQGQSVLKILGLVPAILLMNSEYGFGQKDVFGERPGSRSVVATPVASITATTALRDKLLLYDVTYYGLDLNISTAVTAFGGNTTMRASVGGTPIDTLVIALVNTANGATMIADSVFVDGTRRSFIHHNNLIQIPMNPPIPGSSSFTSRVFYHGNDANAGVGLVRGSKYGMAFMYVNVWPFYASYLFPCKDTMEDWADSVDITIVADQANTVVATGIFQPMATSSDRHRICGWTVHGIQNLLLSSSRRRFYGDPRIPFPSKPLLKQADRRHREIQGIPGIFYLAFRPDPVLAQ
jgi:hypothetical protein